MCPAPFRPVEPLVDRETIVASPLSRTRPASDAVRIKGWTWSDWSLGDRHQQYGTLTIDSHGHGHFECLTYTKSSTGAEGWCAGFSLETATRVKLHAEPRRQGTAMAREGTRYRWSFNFTYDASNFDRIARAVQQTTR